MIRYDLKCAEGHAFDSWFAGSAAFERLRDAGRVSCPACGSAEVEKALMAPGVASRNSGDGGLPLAMGDDDTARAIARLKAHVEKTTDDVGTRFAAEARAMHLGDKPERGIRGQASRDEAKALVEEGVPVMPLPFMLTRKAN